MPSAAIIRRDIIVWVSVAIIYGSLVHVLTPLCWMAFVMGLNVLVFTLLNAIDDAAKGAKDVKP